MKKIKHMRFYICISICLLNLTAISGCGYKADPSAFFPTTSTAIDQEIQRRKNENAKNADPSLPVNKNLPN